MCSVCNSDTAVSLSESSRLFYTAAVV